jgi:hypothetical protein
MDHFAGLDVSVKETSVCIVDETGRIVREVKVASEPEALLAVLKNPAYRNPIRLNCGNLRWQGSTSTRSPRRRARAAWVGMVMPNALAVLRLMMNSNFVGCRTGRSPGLASASSVGGIWRQEHRLAVSDIAMDI